jgi:xanthine dehydrogenase/oxidase
MKHVFCLICYFPLQEFTESGENEVVGRAMMHTSALKQVTGAAVYIDDIPLVAGELGCAIVGSTVAHGKILKVDATDALKLEGVIDFVTAKDIPPSHDGHDPNMIGPVLKGGLSVLSFGNSAPNS